MPERRIGPDRRSPIPAGRRIGVSIEGGKIYAIAAGPDSCRRYLSVIGVLRHVIWQGWNPSRVKRRAQSRKPGNREIQRPPEQVNGTGLAKKRGSKPSHYPVDRHERLTIALYGGPPFGLCVFNAFL